MDEKSIAIKQEIISLLGEINRKGISNVIAYLNQSDYFTAHCHHHHRNEGGLAEHSLDVYHKMREKSPELPDDSCRIVALLHDLCTTHLEGYNEIGSHHHGQRSVELLKVLDFELTEDEWVAISRHMHHVPKEEINDNTQLWLSLYLCDKMSAREQSHLL